MRGTISLRGASQHANNDINSRIALGCTEDYHNSKISCGILKTRSVTLEPKVEKTSFFTQGAF